MNEEELNEAIEALKKATQDYHKMSENCLYFDEYQYAHLMNLAYKLENELKQEKEKNKKLEEQRKIDENSVIELITQLNAEVERCRNLSVELDEASKVINLMVEELTINAEICDKLKDSKNDCYADIEDEKACSNCIKEYYFNKAKGEKK